MSTRKPSPRNRALRPAPEDLEDRQLLSATVSGTDIDGDTWTLRLIGPGTLNVTKQNDASGNPQGLSTPSEINTITVAGAEPTVTRLVGRVRKGPSGDGKVFFQTLNELPSRSERLGSGQSLLSIVMPNFWLGNTTPSASYTASSTLSSITIPDGVNTLKFGGVDTTHNTPPSASAQSDVSSVTLGLPTYGGTRILIDRSISSTQTTTSTPSGSTTPTTTVNQHAVEFNVSGQLALFQANAIQGDATDTPPQFSDLNPNAPSSTAIGGTLVISGTAGGPFLTNTNGTLQGGVTGFIKNLRVGGNATNLTALAYDTSANGSSSARISNFSVGGETDNVLVIAPNGMKNAAFGLGMDKTDILTNVLNSLSANRGALNSNVYVNRTIDRATFGGDVVNSNILAGYNQDFSNIITTVAGISSSAFASSSPAPPPFPQNAQSDGGMEVHVAGDITNSVFAASVQPQVTTSSSTTTQTFGTPQDVVIPTGHIAGKVEGTVDNSSATPDSPNKAFYAAQLSIKHGPVVPPNVPEPPYPKPQQPIHEPGLRYPLQINPIVTKNSDLIPRKSALTSGNSSSTTTSSSKTSSSGSTTTTTATKSAVKAQAAPKGPLSHKAKG